MRRTYRRIQLTKEGKKAVACIAAGAALLALLLFFLLFRVTSIEVVGSTKYTDEEIKGYALESPLTSNTVLAMMFKRHMEAENIPFSAQNFAELLMLIDKGTISTAIAKKVLEEMFENSNKKPSEIIEEKGWIQISDENAIKEVVLKILADNNQSVVDYKAGKDKALGFLVGQAMKATKGKANPQMLNKMFIEEINKM